MCKYIYGEIVFFYVCKIYWVMDYRMFYKVCYVIRIMFYNIRNFILYFFLYNSDYVDGSIEKRFII